MFTVRAFTIILVLLTTSPVWTEPGIPTLLILSLSDDTDRLALETEVVTQLKLELDDLRIEQRDVSETGFVEASRQDKLEEISRMPLQQNVVATCWIETIDNKSILLHMVALEAGRAFIRTIKAERGPRFAEELAFSAQELLGQRYVLTPQEETEAVRGVSDISADDTGASSTKQKGLQASVAPFGQIAGANPGKWLEAGGGVWGELCVRRNLLFVLSMAFMALPLNYPSDGWVSGVAFVPGVEVGYIWWTGIFGAGLNFGAMLGYYKLRTAIGESDRKDVGFFDPVVTVGANLRFQVSAILSVVLSPAVDFRFHTRDLRRVSDNSIIVSSSIASWRLRTGLQFGF